MNAAKELAFGWRECQVPDRRGSVKRMSFDMPSGGDAEARACGRKSGKAGAKRP
jgi:hypothetical protein